ncbi:hypothetical protein [Histidinibacterium aquaticum]|uniref:Uncharacterized protein n=1 Tax=Histidinibacterium aquaticum TaxID=2613962 RepID=A0A5J5GNM4_9RHOB|nr:hypothetical protein [Histidinibacterium aquaticum]KAA9009323.1 hypothetical protein F3S47_08745 [Histidinibacterium aquaticum]
MKRPIGPLALFLATTAVALPGVAVSQSVAPGDTIGETASARNSFEEILPVLEEEHEAALALLAATSTTDTTTTDSTTTDTTTTDTTTTDSTTTLPPPLDMVLDAGIYTEAGIVVEQAGETKGLIATEFNPGGIDGLYSWYPNGSDNGYTVIRLEDGGAMKAVSLLVGNGNTGPRDGEFRLMSNGGILGEGSFETTPEPTAMTFRAPGGFDAIQLRTRARTTDQGTYFDDASPNSLLIDDIRVLRVPAEDGSEAEPETGTEAG